MCPQLKTHALKGPAWRHLQEPASSHAAVEMPSSTYEAGSLWVTDWVADGIPYFESKKQITTMFCAVKNQALSRAEVSVVGWRIIGLSSDELVSNSPGSHLSHDETFW
jgi:hypothetical protein